MHANVPTNNTDSIIAPVAYILDLASALLPCNFPIMADVPMPKPIFKENNLVDIIQENINLLKELDNSIEIIFKKDFDKITLESDKEQISRVFLNH